MLSSALSLILGFQSGFSETQAASSLFGHSSQLHRSSHTSAGLHWFTAPSQRTRISSPPLPSPPLIPISSEPSIPSTEVSRLLEDAYDPQTPAKDIYTPIPGLLVLHIRRGDFDAHCAGLAKWGSNWNGMNRFPSFPDQFEGTHGADGSDPAPAEQERYLRHCLPSIPQIVGKVREVLGTPEGEGLKYVYVMTNAKVEWAEELKGALRGIKVGAVVDGGAGSERWEKIATRRDLTLDWEQTFVSQAVDMLVGQRAQVLIGNGVRSS